PGRVRRVDVEGPGTSPGDGGVIVERTECTKTVGYADPLGDAMVAPAPYLGGVGGGGRLLARLAFTLVGLAVAALDRFTRRFRWAPHRTWWAFSRVADEIRRQVSPGGSPPRASPAS